MVVKKRIVKSKKKSQKKVQQRRSRKKTSKRVSKRRSQRRSRKRVSKKKSKRRSLKVRRSRTKSQKKLIVRRKNSRRRKRSNKKQRGGARLSSHTRDAILERLEGNPTLTLKVNKLFNKSPTRDVVTSFENLLGVAEDKEFLQKINDLVKSQSKLSTSKGLNKQSDAFKTKRKFDRKLSQISSGLTALVGPALYYGVWYLVNKLEIYIPGLGRTLGLISMGMALQKAGITDTLTAKGAQAHSLAIESIHSLSNAAIGKIYQTRGATERIIKVIGARISASKRALMGLNPDTSLYLRFKPEDSVGPHGEKLVAVDVAETNTRFVPIPGKFMIDGDGNLVQVKALVTRPKIHVKYMPYDDFPVDDESIEFDLNRIGVNEEEALFAMAKSAILDQPEPAATAEAALAPLAAAAAAMSEERAATVDVAHMKNYIEGNMDQVVTRVNAGAHVGATLSAIQLNGIVMEAIKQVQDAATSGDAAYRAKKGTLSDAVAAGTADPRFGEVVAGVPFASQGDF